MNTKIDDPQIAEPLKRMLALQATQQEKRRMEQMNPKRISRIQMLPEEVLDNVMGWAQHEGVDAIREKLRSHRYVVGRSTLARYIREKKQAEAKETRAELASTANELAAGKDGTAWRAGAMEALRGKIFDRSLGGGNAAESLQLYQTLVAEDERAKKLALEEERARMQREGLELQKMRLQIEAARGGAKLFLEAIKILDDAGLAAEAKVERARKALAQWKAEAIEVGGGREVKMLKAEN